MIKAVIFDCFGVLHIDPGQYFFEHHVPGFDGLQTQLAELTRACDRGFISQSEYNQQVAHLTGLEPDFVEANMHSLNQRNQLLLDFSQGLRANYSLGMLSNIGRGAMDRFFSQAERDQLFDAVVLSSEVGLIKPQPAIFELMAEQLGVAPHECLMIDDIAGNVAGAEAAGMVGIVHQNNQQTMRQVTEILEQANA